MTQEEVRQLAELQKKFEKRCKEVCSILKDFDGEYEDLCYFIMGGNESLVWDITTITKK